MKILIVLGGSRKRAEKAYELLHNPKNTFDYVILSGTKKEDNNTKHLIQSFVQNHKLFVERYAWDTFTNIFFINRILKKQIGKDNKNSKINLYIITNSEHFKRVQVIWNLKIFGKYIFTPCTLKNIESVEIPGKLENTLYKFFNKGIFFILLGSFYTYLSRKVQLLSFV